MSQNVAKTIRGFEKLCQYNNFGVRSTGSAFNDDFGFKLQQRPKNKPTAFRSLQSFTELRAYLCWNGDTTRVPMIRI